MACATVIQAFQLPSPPDTSRHSTCNGRHNSEERMETRAWMWLQYLFH